MKHNYSKLLNRSLLNKILLTFALVLGSSQAWADETVVDGNTISGNWTNGGATNFDASTGTVTSISQAFLTTTPGQISPANSYSWYSLCSNSQINFLPGQSIEIYTKSLNNYGGELIVRYSADGTTWTNAVDITTAIRNDEAMAAFNKQTVDNISTGSYYIQIIGKAIYINSVVIISGVATTPLLSLSTSTVNFGTKRAIDSQTITVTNSGIGTMNVTIANSNTTDFTVSETSLTGIGAGESQTFNITFNFDENNLGEKSANITVTPDYDASDYKTIAVSATAANPNVWADFTDGIPSTWYNEDNAWVTNVSGLAGQASPGYMSSKVLRTPKLHANAGDEVGFDITFKGTTSSYYIKAQYSTDCINWTDINTYAGNTTTSGTKTFAAPATGDYWLQFTGSQSGINNFTGWSLVPASLDMVIADKDIPTTGVAHGSYTATVTVIERGGTAETVTAELYFGDTKVAEKTGVAVAGNSNVTIELTNENIASFTGNAYIKVTGENISPLQTDNVAVNVTEPDVILDEDNAPSDPKPTCSNTVIQFKYTAQAGWNTIVLPFALYAKDFLTIFGEGYKVYAIDSYAAGVLTFVKKTSYLTTTPYLVYAPNAVANKDNLYLKGISLSAYNWNHANRTQTKGDIVFQGTFEGKTYDAGDPDWYGVTTEGQIKKSAGAGLKGYRAYFTGISAATARIITIDDDGETTDLGFVKMVAPEAQGVYNLQGQRVEKGRKGIYIVNGRKVVIK